MSLTLLLQFHQRLTMHGGFNHRIETIWIPRHGQKIAIVMYVLIRYYLVMIIQFRSSDWSTLSFNLPMSEYPTLVEQAPTSSTIV